jgi:carotenoid cleavage dioxygenase-like enzyme
MEQVTSNAVNASPGNGLGQPLRWSERERTDLPVSVSGALPSWLKGQLVRTAPADFSRGGIAVQHWFDAHCLLYGFEFGQGVHFKQQLLASRHLAANDRGENRMASFGTDLQRGWFRRLLEPVPQFTDNANVNVVPWQGKWLAMTETPHQHVIDPGTLASLGTYEFGDQRRHEMTISAHPHYDAASSSLVNVGTTYGAKNEIWLFRQPKDGRRREVEGKLALKRLPYVHAFGLTDEHAVLIDQPLTVNPLRMLFSNKAFIRHFAWQPERGTRLWKLDRRSGQFTAYETEALFCFHIVNTFEDGADLVLDFLTFDDASLIDALYTDALARSWPSLTPRLRRARLKPGKRSVELETLSDARFDFPQIAYRSHHGKPYRFAWGTSLVPEAGRLSATVHKVDVTSGDALRYTDPEFTYGEPVFVPRPGAAAEDDGVLLAVGSHVSEERSRLAVIDAAKLELLASCEAPLSIPLGFHGTFAAQ